MNQTDSYTRSIHRTGRAGSLLAILWMLPQRYQPREACARFGCPGPLLMALAECHNFEGAGTNHRLLTQYLSAL